jgi:type I restriction enzyme S subunit
MKKNNLRISILQQAIEGKLVPQLAADGNAQDLVDNIREHKAELIREKKLKKDPNESYIYRDDEGHFMERIGKQEPVCIDENLPFAVPEGWTWTRLESIATDILGKTLDNFKNTGEYTPYLCNINIKWGSFDLQSIRKMRFEKEELEKYNIKRNDLLLCEGGEIGKCAVWNEKETNLKFQNAIHRIRFCNDISPYFFMLFFMYYKASNKLEKYGKGVTIKHLTKESLNTIFLPLPPLAEQARIVKKVEELMPLAERFEKQSEELAQLNGALPGKLRKSILQHAIKGLLVPQLAADGNAQDLVDNIREHKAELIREKKLKKDPNESYIYRDDEGHFMERIGKKEPVCIDDDLPFAVPEGWTWARLGEIGEMTIGKTPPRDCNIYWSNGEFPWVSISDMRDEITSTREKLASTAIPLFSKISPKGSLLMSFKLTIGKVSILQIDAYHNEAIITIKPYVDEDYKIRNYLFKILPLMSQFVQGRNAIKGKTLNLKSLHSLFLPLPPLAEQARIVAKVEELMEQVDKMEKAMA